MNMLESLLFYRPSLEPLVVDKRTPNRSPDYGTVKPRVLAYISEHPNSTPAEMHKSLKLNRYSVDRALRKLKAEGLAYVTKAAVQCGKVRSAAEWSAVNPCAFMEEA